MPLCELYVHVWDKYDILCSFKIYCILLIYFF